MTHIITNIHNNTFQWRIQDFPKRGRQPSFWGRRDTILLKFPENCMKSRKIWSLGEAHTGGAPLDPPLHT